MISKRFPSVLTMLALVLTFLLISVSPVQAQTIEPVPLPDPGIPGFSFPTDQSTIHQWVEDNNQTEINKHAWGLWAALTQETEQIYDGQNLRVFETWLTPKNILAGKGNRKTPRPLGTLRQLTHGDLATTDGEETVLGFVKYDPTAARYIIDNDLLSKATLDELLNSGAKKIPDFPITAISLKPVFKAIAQGDLVDERYYKMAAWPGPGQPLPGEARPFPSTDWNQCIWIDIENGGMGNGSVDTDCKDSSSRTPNNTYNVDDFIHFNLTTKEAKFLNSNKKKSQSPYAVGDFSILQAMHVTSKEIPRWTWQTFWWTPNPDQPHFPSSSAIAQDRPEQLQGAARNYAHAPAYSMKYPPQPKTGGKNEGNSVYSYNPWLEAGFSKAVLVDSKPGIYNGNPVPNNVGIQSNCMSCHAQANYNPNNIKNAPNYTGDRYVDLNSPQFDGTLQVDFLWSIEQNAQ